jgi:arylformamidase
METIVHMGTHVDAPRHFYADGPGMDEIPLERMMGEGSLYVSTSQSMKK